MRNKLKDKKLKEIIEKYPFVLSFFEENLLAPAEKTPLFRFCLLAVKCPASRAA